MKEELQNSVSSQIKWPKLGIVEVDSDVDFAYIIRKDGNFTINPIAEKFSQDFGMDYEDAQRVLLQEYDTFVAKLVYAFRWGNSSRGNFEVHLFDPNELEEAARAKSPEIPIISLDPLMHQGVHEFRVSRGYYLSGKKDFGQVPRPGNESLLQQAISIHATLNAASATVVEDDIFSGGSVIASLNSLKESGIVISKVIPGIQVGKPKKIAEMGIIVNPVVIYESGIGTDIFDKVDLGDPRDYLLGGSGLVVKLPNGEYGRSPYILPFVSTTARASIPQQSEREFAWKVLQANFEFFSHAEELLGMPILLSQMNVDFMVMMHTMYGFDKNTPMNQVVVWAMNHIDDIWELNQKQGELQEQLASLDLPQNIVFVDVNGTLFPDDSEDGYVSAEDKNLLNQTILHAAEKGLTVGICSDSPLPQLQKLAAEFDISGPIVAENGNVLYNDGKTLILNSLNKIDIFKQQVIDKAQELGYKQVEDSTAKEFGGSDPDYLNMQWSFGANRVASIGVFGPSKMIEKLGSVLNIQEDVSIDCSPEYNFLAIHPGQDYKHAKGNTLSLLASHGHSIIMIGNSMSDWVTPETGVLCTFVANPRVTDEVEAMTAFISDESFTKGVVDIINKIQ